MRIVRVQHDGAPRWGVLEGDVVRIGDGTPFVDLRPGEVLGPLAMTPLLCPVTPRSIVCIGRNYADHASELGNAVPDEPLVFLKPVSSLVGPGDDVVHPNLSHRVDHEAELVAVIGRTARKVSRAEAWSVIGGWTLGNDVTARDLQKSDPQWTRGKGFDSFCPIGPWIDTDLEPADVRITCHVDGELRQQGSTRDLIFDIPTLVEYITAFMTLTAGDVIMTGTPAGVGPVEVGQTMTVAAPRLGQLTNRVVGDRPCP
jgi:2-keto-4-pentenoate hydratase/2-oxohepta-3-ene-1,7-dioic acid hydratase in catechol pathway